MPREQKIVELLLNYGKEAHRDEVDHLKRGGWMFTRKKPADAFVRSNPNAWLFGVIFDQAWPFEKAWEGPYKLSQRLGHFDMRRIAAEPISELVKVVKGVKGQALHRYINKIPRWLRAAAAKLVDEYQGVASNIWNECRTAGEAIERLIEFDGVSQKKANMAVRLLHEGKDHLWFGANFSRWEEINVAVDVHVRRVWRRTGLGTDMSVAGILDQARKIKPDYPGEMDYPLWLIGIGWCHEEGADCPGKYSDEGEACPLKAACPKRR